MVWVVPTLRMFFQKFANQNRLFFPVTYLMKMDNTSMMQLRKHLSWLLRFKISSSFLFFSRKTSQHFCSQISNNNLRQKNHQKFHSLILIYFLLKKIEFVGKSATSQNEIRVFVVATPTCPWRGREWSFNSLLRCRDEP